MSDSPQKPRSKPIPNQLAITSEYDLFSQPILQRPLDQSRVLRIAEQMEAVGFLSSEQITIDEDWNIIDGQHRYEAAKLAGVPIWYMYDPNLIPANIPIIEGLGKSWTLPDYISAYAKEGRAAYVYIQDTAKNAKIPVSVMCDLLRLNQMLKSKLKRGLIAEIGAEEKERAEFAIKHCQEFRDRGRFQHWNNAPFVRTIAWLLDQDEYKPSRMRQKLEYLSSNLVRCSTVQQYLGVLTNMYNYKVRQDEVVDFADRYKREKNKRWRDALEYAEEIDNRSNGHR